MSNLFFPIGGGDEIGASSYFIQLNETKFLLDSGIRLGSIDNHPRFSALFERELLDGLWNLDAIFISHGHLDHIGALPTAVEEASEVPIYSTLPTKDIMEVQLKPRRVDEAFVDVQAVNEFNEGRVQCVIENVVPTRWNEPIQLNNCKVTFFPAGHILGAAMIYIESDFGNVLFTGDFTSFDQLTVLGFQLPEDLKVDLLITESTYGYQEVEEADDVVAEREIFAQKIEQCLSDKGNVLIPAFAIGRSQEVALILQNLICDGKLKPFTIYIDGLAQHFCDVYETHNVKVFGSNIKRAPKHLMHNLNVFNGVIIASSGMLLNRSASAKYAEKLLPDSRNKIFFSGYLDEESPGHELDSLSRSTGRSFCINRKNVLVNAGVESYRLSAHVNSEGIFELIEKVHPKKVIFVHGVPKYGTKINILRETSKRFQEQIDIYHAINGTPIYF